MFWEPVTFKVDDCLHWQVGPCKLWVCRTADEWQFAIQRDGDGGLVAAQAQEAPPGVAWTRWAAMTDDYTFRILPVMPDRPVIVRPESACSLPPESDSHFYVSIPVWLRLCTGAEGKNILRDEPVSVLSNSWFGDSMEGHLCYALKTTARRSSRQLRLLPHLAACRVHIRNRSERMLAFERLCIHTAHLRIYRDDKRFWTNQVEVTYGGETQPDAIHYTDAPKSAGDAKVITEARQPLKRGIFRKSFTDLKSFVRM